MKIDQYSCVYSDTNNFSYESRSNLEYVDDVVLTDENPSKLQVFRSSER